MSEVELQYGFAFLVKELEQDVDAIINKGSNAIFFKNENIWSY